MRLRLVSGTALGVRHVAETAGPTHAAIFELRGQPISLLLPEVVVISDGDEVVVAGIEKRGLLRGLAYQNKTKRVSGKSAVVLPLVIGVIFCFTVLLCPIGMWVIYIARRNHKAYRDVAEESAGARSAYHTGEK